MFTRRRRHPRAALPQGVARDHGQPRPGQPAAPPAAPALLYAFLPSVSRAYWIFTVMATQVYLIMYVLMFVAAIRLRRTQPDHARGYEAPALGLLCLTGAVSSPLLLDRLRKPAWKAHGTPRP